MLIYSKNVMKFLARLRRYHREILEKEVGLAVLRTRFLFKGYYYPINIVAFEHKSMLGFYRKEKFQIGINKTLMYSAKIPVLKNVLRHEIAHMMMDLLKLDYETPHSPEFRELCRTYGWGEEVYARSANLDLQNQMVDGDLKSEQIISKVQKLLKLSSSSNAHEAQLATFKANQLLLKYNLSLQESSDEEDCVYVSPVFSAKRSSGKMEAIFEILKSFFVHPVYCSGRGTMSIEVTGSKVNVEIAKYVADFLSVELDRIWEKAQEENPSLKGVSHKSSFFKGVSQGYLGKVGEAGGQYSFEEKKALVVVENKLKARVKMVYPRLSYRSVSPVSNHSTMSIGNEAGRRLTINKGVTSKSSKRGLLSFFRS